MKEYNWRKEREKYQPDFNKRTQEETDHAAETNLNQLLPLKKMIGGILLIVAIVAVVVFFIKIQKSKNMSSARLNASNPATVASFEDILRKNEHAVGVVCLKFSYGGWAPEFMPFGTAWAMSSHQYATNAHIVKDIQKFAQLQLTKAGYQYQMAMADVKNLEALLIAYGKPIFQKKAEEAKQIALQELLRKYNAKSAEQIQAAIGKTQMEGEWNVLTENVLVNKFGIKDQIAWLVNAGKEECERQNIRAMNEIRKKAEFSVVIIINKMPHKIMNVTHIQIHPRYSGAYSPDAGILTVAESAPAVFKIASQKKLYALQQGTKIAFLGFPMEGITGNNINLEAPTATFQEGNIIAISDFALKDTKSEYSYLIRHNLPNPGGSSGSPIFDLDGEVIALNNMGSVNYVKTDEGKTRIDSAAMVNGGIRVDLLNGVGPKIPLQDWINKAF